jgi:hypothetical protein
LEAVDDERKKIVTFIGMALLVVQATEQIIRLVTTHVIPGPSPLTFESLRSRSRDARNRTIGFLLGKLRERVDLDETFDECLRRFLEMRNTFIHNLDEVPGWSLDTEQGCTVAEAFLVEFFQVIDIVQNVFLGLIRSWQEQVDMSHIGFPTAGHPWFAEIDAKFKPLAERIFFSKGG